MFRIALVVTSALACFGLATAGCRTSLENDTPDDGSTDAPISAACMEATTYQNLASIESKIFKQSCVFSGCHNGANTDAGRLDLREGMAHADLVNVSSEIDTRYKMVAPSQPTQSFLLFMLGHIAPADMPLPNTMVPGSGYMPQNSGGQLLCSQKREAIARWIMAGALND